MLVDLLKIEVKEEGVLILAACASWSASRCFVLQFQPPAPLPASPFGQGQARAKGVHQCTWILPPACARVCLRPLHLCSLRYSIMRPGTVSAAVHPIHQEQETGGIVLRSARSSSGRAWVRV